MSPLAPGDVGPSVELSRDAVGCPWCAAPAGELCREDGSRIADRVHEPRLRAWIRHELAREPERARA